MLFSFVLLACTAPSTSFDSRPFSGGSAAEDTGVAEDTGSTADTAVVDDDSPCYSLEGHSGTGCYTTRPYISIDMQLAVPVYESNVVIWDVEVEAAPEGWVGLNNLGGWLSFHDASGSGWTNDVMDNLAYTDQFGDSRGIVVQNSNPAGKSIVIGEAAGAEGDWAVKTVDAGDTVTVTFTLNIEGLSVSRGDWVQLDLNTYQAWSSIETSSTESQFGTMVGTRFLFQ